MSTLKNFRDIHQIPVSVCPGMILVLYGIEILHGDMLTNCFLMRDPTEIYSCVLFFYENSY